MPSPQIVSCIRSDKQYLHYAHSKAEGMVVSFWFNCNLVLSAECPVALENGSDCFPKGIQFVQHIAWQAGTNGTFASKAHYLT